MKNQIRLFASCLVVFMLAGCGGGRKANEKPLVGLYPELRIPASDYLSSNQEPKRGYGAYGYLLFTNQPMESDLQRYVRVCQLFRSKFVSERKFSPSYQSHLMITYWLLDSPITADTARCESLINHYDYARAIVLTSSIKRQGVRGPLLVAWTTVQKVGIPEPSTLILDLSDFSDDDIDLGFAIWKERISMDPNEWNNGFTLQKALFEFHSLIQKYGQQIVDVFKG